MKNNRPRNLGFILIGIGLVVVVAGIYGVLRPEEFQARTRIRLEWNSSSAELDPNFVETETKSIQSEIVLSNVMHRLDLGTKWSKQYYNNQKLKTSEIVTRLRNRLEVHQVRNTTLVEICVVSYNPNEAALIANTIYETSLDWRPEQERRADVEGVAALTKRLEAQARKVEDAKSNLTQLWKELNIPESELQSDSLRTNYPTFYQARNKLEEVTDVQNLIARKKMIAEANLRVSIGPWIFLVERAVPPATPTSHHRQLGAALLFVGLAAFAWGFVMLRISNAKNS